ncbi:MAG: hypothetical protein AAF799_33470 [Myxococcota bacterium]
MSRSIPLLRGLRALLMGLLLGGFGLASSPAWAGPGRPDPRQMSGIPRPDPQIPAGEVTVRVLRGSFDQPALDAVVELELRSPDGRLAALRSSEAGNQGRVHFRDLGDFTGGQAVARVVLDGETIRSQQIDILPETGTAVMLVKGAPKRAPTQEISLPGIVFDFPKTPPGTLMVGVFDLGKRQGLTDVEVQLVVTTADGQQSTNALETGPMGQATFEGIADIPADATLQVQTVLDDGPEPYRSMVFSPQPAKGQAIVLARGRMSRAGGSPHEGGAAASGAGGDNPHAPAARRKLPPPQISTKLAPGTVSALVLDSKDQPLANQAITIVKKDFSGTETRFEAKTGPDGIATHADLPVVNDALYYIAVSYDAAPYTSSFFGLDKRGGVTVAMRVWPVTSDPAVARSAIQFEIIEAENDSAQVIQIYEVLVTGEEAYWPGKEPLVIEGIEGAKGLVVLRGADDWLDHEDKAPFATLSHPIPPGEVAALSIGYLIDGHDGTIELDWAPPFQIIESAVVVSDQLTLDAPGAKRSEREIPDQPGLDYTRVAYELGQQGTGPVRATVSGLRGTERIYAKIGIVVGLALALVALIGVVTAPRGTAQARLERRRDALLAALETSRDERKRRRMVAALDRVYRQLGALEALADKQPQRSKGASA